MKEHDALPHDERARLEEIIALDLTASEVDEVLEEITERAATALGLPISLVTVLFAEAQHFAASHGLEGWKLEAGGTPVEWSFCAKAIEGSEPYVIEDATRHPLFRDNPLVTQDGVQCYAGIPLVTSTGHALGTLCVLGTEERSFSRDELDTLRRLADKAVARIEARRQVRCADVTG